MRSACSTSSARDNGHGGRWWTLRGRRNQRPPPAGTTEPPAEQEETRSPLTDSNRRPPPYQTSRATGRNPRQRFWRLFAALAPIRFATHCHRLQPRGSIRAPSSVVDCGYMAFVLDRRAAVSDNGDSSRFGIGFRDRAATFV